MLALRARRTTGEALADEARRLSGSLHQFIRAGWHVVEPFAEFVDGWHIGAVCEQLERVSDGEIRNLQIWVPPGTMKSRAVSIFWPVWEWTERPGMRYLTASYALDLATEFAVKSRDLILSDWHQARWGDLYNLKSDANLKRSYENDRGGGRYATSPKGGGTGRHAHRIVIDDPIDAKAADATAQTSLDDVIEWNDGTLPTRFADPKTGAKVIVMQRLHEKDLAGHVLEQDEWTVLCLPERYEPAHPFAWPDDAREPGELLWPERIGEEENAKRVKQMGQHRSAGQLQQRPAAREGSILKRSGWRYYDPEILAKLEGGDPSGFPKFSRIFTDWDTSFKEKSSSDYVAGGIWGIHGADHYLLKVWHERMSLSATKTAMKDARRWIVDRFGSKQIYVVIENAANGVEIREQLAKEITGVVKFVASTDKTSRAEAAEPAFDSGNVYIPGAMLGTLGDYDPASTPAWAQEVVEQCATFPSGAHDDLVDMVTMAINWNRTKNLGRTTVTVPRGRAVTAPTGEGPRRAATGRQVIPNSRGGQR